MSRTHFILQNPSNEYIIYPVEESGLTEEKFLDLRHGRVLEYPDGLYTFMYSGTFEQCVFGTPIIHNKTPPFTTPRLNSFSTSFNKRPIYAIDEEEDSNKFKRSRIEVDENEFLTLKVTVADLSTKFVDMEKRIETVTNENIELRSEIQKLKPPPKLRANRATEDQLSKMTVIDEHDVEVLLSSLSDRQIKILLERKQQSLGDPPSHPGLNHQDVIDKIGSALLYELTKKSTTGFALRIASYFINREAFLITYFKPLVVHSANNHNNSNNIYLHALTHVEN
uniref:FHA domain-containing protein n=1 Tax=Panagrolaimus sp. ES5 TaxID=591445 RepID=A0AC34FAG6_9BILA